jgi:hypothetical protein
MQSSVSSVVVIAFLLIDICIDAVGKTFTLFGDDHTQGIVDHTIEAGTYYYYLPVDKHNI